MYMNKKMMIKEKKEENWFLEKKYFYVSELHMGIDGLENITDHKGPFKSLKTAQNSFEKYVNASKYLNDWEKASFSIRGPMYTRNAFKIGDKNVIPSYDTIWYNNKGRK